MGDARWPPPATPARKSDFALLAEADWCDEHGQPMWAAWRRLLYLLRAARMDAWVYEVFYRAFRTSGFDKPGWDVDVRMNLPNHSVRIEWQRELSSGTTRGAVWEGDFEEEKVGQFIASRNDIGWLQRFIASRLTRGDLGGRIDVMTIDELGDLCGA